MIHIATVHWNSDRWIAIQDAYLRRHLKNDFRVYAWLNNIPDAPRDSFYYTCSEPVDSHAVKLNILADVIRASTVREDDILIFLDGDAFPVGAIETLIQQALPARKLLAVQRFENNGDPQPHPCFCATTVGFWQSIKGDWKGGHQWKNKDGKLVTDVGGNLLKQLAGQRIDWLPLIRSNRVNVHPLFFGVYGDAVYHHGAGFRGGTCRADRAKRQDSFRDKLLAKIVPGYGRRLDKKFVRDMILRNDALRQRIFETIQKDPEFYRQFM